MKKLFILKLGGSAITYKDLNLPKANIEIIENAAKEIKKAKDENDFNLIIVHGAGPFGHKYVSDYGITNGLVKEKDFEGFVVTHQSVNELNNVVVNTFRYAGLLPFPIQPSACIIQKNKKIKSFGIDIIKALLDISSDIIPVMHGDMVIDTELKASVVSGDAIISYLGKALKTEKILFGADIDGIYTSDPKKNKNAVLIPEVNSENLISIIDKVAGSSNIDVTGGMKGKLSQAQELPKDTESWIFNITQSGNLYKALSGKKITGTKIMFG